MEIEVPDSIIPYSDIVQDSLRAVVGRVLASVGPDGDSLPGDHHFYITFKTRAEGVQIPQHLAERFTDEMTIVLQNKFWDLKAGDESFSVGLTFSGTPTTVIVPYQAITAFMDPSVDFGLQFASSIPGQEEPGQPAVRPVTAHSEPGENVVTVDFGRRS